LLDSATKILLCSYQGKGKIVTDGSRLYQRIGEYVVVFQGLENKFREIGWLIQDPHRKEWPPRSLRSLTTEKLIDRVKELYLELLDGLKIDEAVRQDRKAEFEVLCITCHDIRRYRNTLLHSAYIELEAGGEVVALLRSDPKLRINPETGEIEYDQEILSEDGIVKEMQKVGEIFVRLDRHYRQLIHWAPFGKT
jgi:hypothetical protein